MSRRHIFLILALPLAALLLSCAPPDPIGAVVDATSSEGIEARASASIERLSTAVDAYLLTAPEQDGTFLEENEARLAELEGSFVAWSEDFAEFRSRGGDPILSNGVNGDDLVAAFGDWVGAQREQTDLTVACVEESADPERCRAKGIAENTARWDRIAARLSEVRAAAN